MIEVRWKPVVGAPRYTVSDAGEVLSMKWGRAHLLTPSLNAYGYPTVSPVVNGKNKTMPIHRLVLEAFVGPRPSGGQCRHLNGDKTDNHLSNLCWGTAKENRDDQTDHGTVCQGEAHHAATLSAEVVAEIRSLASGVTVAELAVRFGVTKQTVSDAIKGKTWAHVPGATSATAHLGEGHRSARLTAETVRAMRAEHAAGASARSLAKRYGVAYQSASKVLSRKTWRHVE